MRKLQGLYRPAGIVLKLQWGRNFIVAETSFTGSLPLLLAPPLQWGRNFIVAETYRSGSSPKNRFKLQWGRNFIVAETWAVSRPPIEVLRLQWGRNFIVAETIPNMWNTRTSRECFNGAATLSLRKLGHPVGALVASLVASMGPQLYRCGNSARRWSWIAGRSASMGPQLYRCGNSPSAGRYRRQCSASMGPQLYRCGNFHAFLHHACYDPRFNGAATLSLRKHAVGVGADNGVGGFNGAATLSLRKPEDGPEKARESKSFNGAATLSLRKRAPAHAMLRSLAVLQWGRNFIVAETRFRCSPWISRG